MPRYAQLERAALCDTLGQAGPDAPTLCEGWATKHLAAHLLIRERRPDAAAAMLLPALRGHRDRVEALLTGQDWARTVGMLRGGPPRWSVFALPGADEKANLGEFFVHHEDVRRASGDTTPRDLASGEQHALWNGLARMGALLLRHVRTGVVIDAPGFGRRSVRSAKDDHGTVVLTGPPAEILLQLFGRGSVAQVTVHGADRDLEAFRTARLGF